MAQYTLLRTLRHLTNTPPFPVVFVGLVVFFSFRWVVTHNHDGAFGPGPAPRPTANVDSKLINWDQYKYVQIVATPEDLCSAVMVWSQIEGYGSRATRLMLYPSNWDLEEVNQTNSANSLTATARLLQQTARESYVKLQPVDALNTNNTSPLQWTNSAYTKLLAFNLTSFSRVLVLDPASKVLQNMDEPFLLPRAPIAMPYIYFGDPTGWAFSSHLMLVSPSQSSFQVVERAVKAARGRSHDVEIINQLFPSEIQRLDHKRYGLFTGELRRKSHVEYLGSSTAKWDLDAILAKAKYLYYSDSPIPKPWFKASQDLLNRHMPNCVKSEWFGASNCRDREMWFKLYADYARKRKAICGVDFEVKNVVGQGNNFEY